QLGRLRRKLARLHGGIHQRARSAALPVHGARAGGSRGKVVHGKGRRGGWNPAEGSAKSNPCGAGGRPSSPPTLPSVSTTGLFQIVCYPRNPRPSLLCDDALSTSALPARDPGGAFRRL